MDSNVRVCVFSLSIVFCHLSSEREYCERKHDLVLHTAVKPLACWQNSTEPIESESETHFDCCVCVFWVSSFFASFAVTLNTTMMSVGSAQQLFGWQNPEKYYHFSCALENSMHSFRSSGQNKDDVAVHSFLQKSFIFTFDFWIHLDNSVALNYVKQI